MVVSPLAKAANIKARWDRDLSPGMGTLPERGDEAAWQDRKDMNVFFGQGGDQYSFF
jgi:hypothetical protein